MLSDLIIAKDANFSSVVFMACLQYLQVSEVYVPFKFEMFSSVAIWNTVWGVQHQTLSALSHIQYRAASYFLKTYWTTLKHWHGSANSKNNAQEIFLIKVSCFLEPWCCWKVSFDMESPCNFARRNCLMKDKQNKAESGIEWNPISNHFI